MKDYSLENKIAMESVIERVSAMFHCLNNQNIDNYE